MRVATLNLASGRDATGRSLDAAALEAALGDFGADVVAVQEVDRGQPRSHGVDQPAVVARALGAVDGRWAPTVAGTPGPQRTWRAAEPLALHGPGDGPAGPHYGVALYSRHPVRRWHVLELGTGRARLPVPTGRESPRLVWVPDEPRAAVAAELDGLTVVGTHLSFAPVTAGRQLARIRDWARGLPGPVVVAGDLNLVGPVPELVSGGIRLVRAPTFPAHDPRVQLDHVLALGYLRGGDARAWRLAFGDHRAVAVTVGQPAPP